jgi:hypothetical protein
MASPTPLSANLKVALKEWATVCSALETGRQMILLRKGGIYEAAGEFQLEHRQFVLFPTHLHQNVAMLKQSEHAAIVPHTAEPSHIRLSAMGVVTDIVPMSKRSTMDLLDDEHIWTKPLIEMRFTYRPENPLYLLLVRAYVLAEPVTIENTPAYAGCKSWVPLETAIDAGDARAVLDDAAYAKRRTGILQKNELRSQKSE